VVRVPSCVRIASAGLALWVMGCEPDFDIDGAFFPAWIVCMAAGGVLSVVVHLVLVRLRLEPWIGPPILIYPCLYLLLTLLTWIVFFRS
jgi:YtcA family